MRADETRKYEMLVRVREFGSTHGDLFPKTSLAGQAFEDVGNAVEALSQHAVSKMSAARDSVRARGAARKALRRRVEAMHQTARVIGKDTAGLDDKFQLPVTHGDQALLTAARLFARDAEPFGKAFIARAMPKTFVEDLLGLAQKLEEAIKACDADREMNAAARANITRTFEKGFSAAEALDAMVTNHLEADPAGIAMWTTARRIDPTRAHTRRRARAKDAPTSPAPTVVAATPPVAEPSPAPVSAASSTSATTTPAANVPQPDQKVA